jgi:SAM-dependent methyltransferase
MYRVLGHDGRLLITVPFIWGEHEVPFDFRRYSTFGVEQLLASTKFKIVRLDRLTRGVDAVEMLVASEINNYEVNVAKRLTENAARRARKRFLRAVIRRVWPVQLRLWRELYAFERIYIDNLVIAVKE